MSELVERDPGPMARLGAVVGRPETASVVFQRLTDADAPETLREIAKAWGVPAGRFVEWFTTEHGELYDTALKVRADQLANDALLISDEQEAVEKKDGSTFDPDVGRDKLRVDTRLKLASKWDRARYGETVKIDRTISVTADAGLVGLASELLARVTMAQEKTVLPETLHHVENEEDLI